MAVEVMIECWSGPEGADYLWSVWSEGARLDMGGPEDSAEAAEAAARAYCRSRYGAEPDAVLCL